MYQGEELLKTGKITLPLPGPQRSYVVDIKKGNLDFTKDVQPEIERGLKLLEELVEKSSLRSEVDSDILKSIVIEHHLAVVKEGHYD